MVGRMATPEKASRPTLRNLDRDSNLTDESDLHPAKHFSPKTLTDEGITISINPLD
jgi:hypothetical protein